MAQSDLEAAFIFYWRAIDGPPVTPEYRFDSRRKFRLDFAHLDSKTGIEVEGGIWTQKGRHTSGQGYTNDCIKYNLATSLGWRIFRLTGDMLKSDPQKHLTMIKQFIERNERQ